MWLDLILSNAGSLKYYILSTVQPSFRLDKNFEDTIILKLGSSKVIEVPFMASPMPEINWDFNGGKFSDAKRIKGESLVGIK